MSDSTSSDFRYIRTKTKKHSAGDKVLERIASKAFEQFGPYSMGIVLATAETGIAVDTTEECYFAGFKMLAMAVTKKLPFSGLFFTAEADANLPQPKPENMLKALKEAQAAGADCWLNRRGTVITVGTNKTGMKKAGKKKALTASELADIAALQAE